MLQVICIDTPVIPKTEGQAVDCPKCGKRFESNEKTSGSRRLMWHQRQCKGGRKKNNTPKESKEYKGRDKNQSLMSISIINIQDS